MITVDTIGRVRRAHFVKSKKVGLHEFPSDRMIQSPIKGNGAKGRMDQVRLTLAFALSILKNFGHRLLQYARLELSEGRYQSPGR